MIFVWKKLQITKINLIILTNFNKRPLTLVIVDKNIWNYLGIIKMNTLMKINIFVFIIYFIYNTIYKIHFSKIGFELRNNIYFTLSINY